MVGGLVLTPIVVSLFWLSILNLTDHLRSGFPVMTLMLVDFSIEPKGYIGLALLVATLLTTVVLLWMAAVKLGKLSRTIAVG